MVVEEILGPYMLKLHNFKDLNSLLDDISETAKAWVENLNKPVLYILLFIRAEREGCNFKDAAGNHDYALYGTYNPTSEAVMKQNMI